LCAISSRSSILILNARLPRNIPKKKTRIPSIVGVKVERED
jgi:hypothetical protein